MTFYPYGTQALLPLVWGKQPPLNETGVNTLYYVCRRRMLTKQFDWPAGQPYAYLVSSAYVFDPSHETVGNLPSPVRISQAPILLRSVNAHGWACSVGVEFPNVKPVISGLDAAAVIFAEGNSEASYLIACFNQVLELPFTPDGRSWFFYPNAGEAGTAVGSGGWWTP